MQKLGKNARLHPILSIPVLASILTFIYTYVLRLIVIGISDVKLGELSDFIGVALAIVMLIIHKLWFRPEYRGSFRKDLLKDKSIIIPVVIYLVIDIGLIAIGWIQQGVQMLTLAIVATALMAGVGEEVSYRVVVMTTELRIWVRNGSYFPALFISSLMFGLSHLINLFAGASLPITVLQVCETFVAGLFMGTIFVRTGSVLYPIIIHVLHDMLELMTFGSNVVQNKPLTLEELAVSVVLIIVQIITMIWLLKGRKIEIISIWKERWSVSDND